VTISRNSDFFSHNCEIYKVQFWRKKVWVYISYLLLYNSQLWLYHAILRKVRIARCKLAIARFVFRFKSRILLRKQADANGTVIFGWTAPLRKLVRYSACFACLDSVDHKRTQNHIPSSVCVFSVLNSSLSHGHLNIILRAHMHARTHTHTHTHVGLAGTRTEWVMKPEEGSGAEKQTPAIFQIWFTLTFTLTESTLSQRKLIPSEQMNAHVLC